MPTLSTSDITSIIDYIQSTESFLKTSVTSKLGEQQAFDFATGLIPVGTIPADEEDLTLLNGHVTDLDSAIALLKAARDGSSDSGGDCSAIATALNNLSAALNFSSLLNSISALITSSQNVIMAVVNAINTTVNSISTTVGTIRTTVNTINTNLSSLTTTVNTINTNVSTINTNVSSIQTTVGTINTRTLTTNSNVNTINTNVNTILGWNNTGGVLPTISTCCANLTTNLNLTPITTSLNTILAWANTGGILFGINANVNTIIGWTGSTGPLTNIYSDTESIKTTVSALNSSGGTGSDITAIKNCCTNLSGTVGNNLTLSNTINTLLNSWVAAGGVLTTLSSCCTDVDNKVTALGAPVDLSGINSKLDNITSKFIDVSGSITSEQCDLTTTQIAYTGNSFAGISSLLSAISNQINQQHIETCNKFSGISLTVSGSIPLITCNDDGTYTSNTTTYNNLSTALNTIGTSISTVHQDLCKKGSSDCTVLYPVDAYAEFNYDSQMTIWFKDSEGSMWDFKVPNPKPFTQSDWCSKIHPISISKGNVYGRINYSGSKVATSGYFASQAEATRVLNLLGSLSSNTYSDPRITFNPQPKRIPKETTIYPDSVIIATIVNGKVTNKACYRAPTSGC